jgi:flagellar motor protein MotB
MTTSWRDEYMEALQDRDERERASYQRVDEELIAAFTSLLDRTAALEAEKAALQPSISTPPQTSRSPTPSTNKRDSPTTNDPSTAQLRLDLAETLRSNGQLQNRIKTAETELVKLRLKSKNEAKQVESLTKERAFLMQKLKDRDEELRGKTKLLDDLHDEVISFNLQLNMSEQKVKQLKAENKELIDRWMASKGREAEEMNKKLQDQFDGK